MFNIREKFPLFRLEILAGQTFCCQCCPNHIRDGSCIWNSGKLCSSKKIDTSVVSLLIYNPHVRDILVKSVGPTVENSKDREVDIFLNTANGSIS